MREAGLTVPVIVQTAHGGIDNVVQRHARGRERFRGQAGRRRAPAGVACATRSPRARSQANCTRIKRSRSGTLTFKDIVTRSPRMHAVLAHRREGRRLRHSRC